VRDSFFCGQDVAIDGVAVACWAGGCEGGGDGAGVLAAGVDGGFCVAHFCAWGGRGVVGSNYLWMVLRVCGLGVGVLGFGECVGRQWTVEFMGECLCLVTGQRYGLWLVGRDKRLCVN